jgi:hypothetical protein
MKYPMKMLNISQLFLLILPVYYVLVMPFALILNFIDSHAAHRSGTGLVVLAWK